MGTTKLSAAVMNETIFGRIFSPKPLLTFGTCLSNWGNINTWENNSHTKYLLTSET